MADMRTMIDQAVAEGRVNRLPMAEPEQPKPGNTKFHPEHCSKGHAVGRARFLDELDGDRS